MTSSPPGKVGVDGPQIPDRETQRGGGPSFSGSVSSGQLNDREVWLSTHTRPPRIACMAMRDVAIRQPFIE